MAKTIYVPVKCYCCGYPMKRTVLKPAPGSKSVFKNECEDCESINTYRLSLKQKDLTVETIHVTSTEIGRECYEARTGKPFFETESSGAGSRSDHSG